MSKFTASVKKLRGRHVVEIPETLAKALPKGSTVLVDFKVVQPPSSKPNGKKQRNLEILARSRSGLTDGDLASIYGINVSTIKTIIEETAHLEEIGSLGLYLSTATMNVMAKAFGLCEPTLAIFKRYITSNHNWRKAIFAAPRGGISAVREIEHFCQANGIPC